MSFGINDPASVSRTSDCWYILMNGERNEQKRGGFKKRQYTDEFKVEAVRLGNSIGGNQAAKRLGIPESSL
jgi:hypothetical protein